MRTRDLDYELPPELIATHPVEPRDAARIMVVRRPPPGSDAPAAIEHRRVRDLPELLAAGDLLVVNDSAVVPALLTGRRIDTGGAIEGLFLETLPPDRWLVLLKAGGRLRPGLRLALGTDGGAETVVLELLERRDDAWAVRVESAHGDASAALAAVGATPLPPYIRAARRARGESYGEAADRRWYQAIYADAAHAGSVAAPTAGLHFTPELLARLEAAGIARVALALHVGTGTFRPVTAEELAAHPMHEERYRVPPDTLRALRDRTPAPGRRTIAIGTTAVRALESLPHPLPDPEAGAFDAATRLLVAPPYDFRFVHGLLTNFHLPRSTLLALVAALVGLDVLLACYREAVRERYRFYSYGDAMLVL